MPENQNMQKTSDNEAMLQEIVQNTEMGKNTLDELMGLTYDQKLKDEMMRQKNEYRRLNQQAHTALDAIGAQAKSDFQFPEIRKYLCAYDMLFGKPRVFLQTVLHIIDIKLRKG